MVVKGGGWSRYLVCRSATAYCLLNHCLVYGSVPASTQHNGKLSWSSHPPPPCRVAGPYDEGPREIRFNVFAKEGELSLFFFSFFAKSEIIYICKFRRIT